VERVDNSIADLVFGSVRNVVFDGNTFNGIGQVTQNPVTIEFDQSSEAVDWQIDAGGWLPFGGKAREVTSIVTEGAITTATGSPVFALPYVTTEAGAHQNEVTLTWPEPVKGRVHVTARVDRPV
jgi:hypothetical protein